MHKPRLRPNFVCDPIKEGDHIMFEHRFLGVNRCDIDLGFCRPPIPKRLGAALRHNTQIGELLRRMSLNLEPDAIFRFRLPNGAHFRTGITRNHRSLR